MSMHKNMYFWVSFSLNPCFLNLLNCAFPKSALLNLGNGKYSTIRVKYP